MNELEKCVVEMTVGFPIPWESHRNGNKTPTWEWEGVGINVYGNGYDPNSMAGGNSHGFFTVVDLH